MPSINIALENNDKNVQCADCGFTFGRFDIPNCAKCQMPLMTEKQLTEYQKREIGGPYKDILACVIDSASEGSKTSLGHVHPSCAREILVDGQQGIDRFAAVLRAGRAPITKPKQTIYLVTTGSYSDYRIIGAFSTKSNAEMIQTQAEADAIEEYELDEITPLPEGMDVFNVEIRKDGAARADKDDAEDWLCGHETFRWYAYDVQNGPITRLLLYIVATDRTHAVKIANEKRALILASDAWGDEKRTRELLGDKPRTEQQH